MNCTNCGEEEAMLRVIGSDRLCMGCVVGEVMKLRTAVTATAVELSKERRRSEDLHRRAQAVEGMAEHLAKLHEGFAISFKWLNDKAHSWRAMWRDRYRAAVKQIVTAGVSDHVEGHPSHYKEGHLDVLIGRLVGQRDAASARIAELERVGALLYAQVLDGNSWLNFGATRPGAGLCICNDLDAISPEDAKEPAEHDICCKPFREAIAEWMKLNPDKFPADKFSA